jgi:hypothetical protein
LKLDYLRPSRQGRRGNVPGIRDEYVEDAIAKCRSNLQLRGKVEIIRAKEVTGYFCKT